jgi:ABC-type bacteriocin/lantibiotic exporter with double-glycine peptidase domain
MTGEWTKASPKDVRGTVRLAKLIDTSQKHETLQRDGLVWPVLRSFRSRLLAVFWQSFFISLIGLAVSLYVMYVYDKAIGTGSADTLIMFALGALAGLAIEMVLRARRARGISWIGARFDAIVASNSLKSVLSLPLAMSEGAPLGAQLTRFRQFEVGRELFGGSLATALIDLPFTLVFFAVIFALGGWLGLVPVALAVILAVIGLVSDPISAKQSQEMGEWKAKSDTILVEITTRMRTIKDDNAETIWLDVAAENYRRYLAARFRSLQFSSALQTIAQSLVSVAGVGVLGLGSLEVMQGTLSIGALIAVMAVVWRVLGPIQTVFLSLNRVKMMLRTVRQIEQLMKIKPERPPNRMAAPERRLAGAISLSNACLRYGTRQELALKAVSLTIAPGEFLTIAGSSGSGKSTLCKAILGLYQIQSGTIRLDDVDLRQLDPSDTRQAIGYLAQEPALFFGTIAQNLRLVAPDATQEELVAALATMGIQQDHPALREGLETRLSAANRQVMSFAFVQRIALARMFVRPRPILLFDEPGTHLDREGDEALMAAVAQLKGRCTIVMVTERPSHMRRSDRVIVMQEGQIAGQGKPEEIVPLLMAQATRPAA